jgi:hypothetical protein
MLKSNRHSPQNNNGASMRLVVLVVVLCSALVPQEPKKPLKPFKAPEPPAYAVENPLLAKDEGCAKDYAKALTLEGLEQRKILADLIAFGCVTTPYPGHYLVNILELREFPVGDHKVQFANVKLMLMSLYADAKYTQVLEGWIFRPTMTKFTKEQMDQWMNERPKK